MNTTSPDTQQFDLVPLAAETVVLSATSTQWATNSCRDIADDDDQWQAFLRALAVAGVDQWLSGTGLAPIYSKTTAPTAEINLRVGDYRLCILPIDGLSDDTITVSVGTQAAHLYLLAEVQEEVNHVRVVTGLRHDQLLQYVQPRSNPESSSYSIPLTQFTVTPEQLLLYLNCLEPEKIIQPSRANYPNEIAEAITTGVVNVGKWLQGELGTLAEQLAWELLPPLTPAQGFRPVREEIEDIVVELVSQGIEIPPQARGAYKAIAIPGFACRLYAWTWPLMTDNVPEWSLFLILGPAPGETMPFGIELTVSDQQTILSSMSLTQETAATYLYAQVIGYWQEQFTVTIGLPHGATINLPPFGFQVEQ